MNSPTHLALARIVDPLGMNMLLYTSSSILRWGIAKDRGLNMNDVK